MDEITIWAGRPSGPDHLHTLIANETVPELTPEERHAAAVALGRLGGKKGGKARAAKLTPEQRSEGARKAAQGSMGSTILVLIFVAFSI